MASTPAARDAADTRSDTSASGKRRPHDPPVDGSESKSARTRRRILGAAAFVLARRGYAGTKVAEIAQLAELRVPAIYYYFPTRDAIVEEVTTVGVRQTREHVAAAVDALGDASPMDRLVTAASAHLEMMLRESDYAAAAMRNAAQLPPRVRSAGLAEERLYGDLWRDLFADAAEDLDPDLDPRGARMLILGALNWAPDWWDPQRGSLAEIRATAERLVRNALNPGGPTAS